MHMGTLSHSIKHPVSKSLSIIIGADKGLLHTDLKEIKA